MLSIQEIYLKPVVAATANCLLAKNVFFAVMFIKPDFKRIFMLNQRISLVHLISKVPAIIVKLVALAIYKNCRMSFIGFGTVKIFVTYTVYYPAKVVCCVGGYQFLMCLETEVYRPGRKSSQK